MLFISVVNALLINASVALVLAPNVCFTSGLIGVVNAVLMNAVIVSFVVLARNYLFAIGFIGNLTALLLDAIVIFVVVLAIKAFGTRFRIFVINTRYDRALFSIVVIIAII